MLAAFAKLEGVTGRRVPSLDQQLIHVFGIVMRFVHEKVDDVHGTRIIVLDPTGDTNFVEEQYLVSQK